jgi:hypothetical protein
MLDACSMTCAANASPAIKHRIAWLDMHGVKLELESVFIPFAKYSTWLNHSPQHDSPRKTKIGDRANTLLCSLCPVIEYVRAYRTTFKPHNGAIATRCKVPRQ